MIAAQSRSAAGLFRSSFARLRSPVFAPISRKELTTAGDGSKSSSPKNETKAASDDTKNHNETDASENQSSSSSVPPRAQILEAALSHVNSVGWSTEALAAGARQVGYSSMAHGLFPSGGIDLVRYFVVKCNRQMAEHLATQDLLSMKVKDRVRTAVKTRLEYHIPYIGSWPQALALEALPQNAPESLRLLAILVDEMWHHAGDRSTDINWYTKRAMLAGVYTSTELFMLTDYTTGYEDTWEFLDRRIDDVMILGKLASQGLESPLGAVVSGASLLWGSLKPRGK